MEKERMSEIKKDFMKQIGKNKVKSEKDDCNLTPNSRIQRRYVYKYKVKSLLQDAVVVIGTNYMTAAEVGAKAVEILKEQIEKLGLELVEEC